MTLAERASIATGVRVSARMARQRELDRLLADGMNLKRAALRHYLKTQPGEFGALIQTLADRDARGARPPVPGVLYHERKKAA